MSRENCQMPPGLLSKLPVYMIRFISVQKHIGCVCQIQQQQQQYDVMSIWIQILGSTQLLLFCTSSLKHWGSTLFIKELCLPSLPRYSVQCSNQNNRAYAGKLGKNGNIFCAQQTQTRLSCSQQSPDGLAGHFACLVRLDRRQYRISRGKQSILKSRTQCPMCLVMCLLHRQSLVLLLQVFVETLHGVVNVVKFNDGEASLDERPNPPGQV